MDDRDKQKYEKLRRYLQWAITLAVLAVLGSCVMEIDGVGAGHDSNRKMAGIFFFHVFLIVPCLFGLFVFLQLKLEKHFLSKDTIDELNAAHMKYAKNETRQFLGRFSPLLSALFKRKPKK